MKIYYDKEKLIRELEPTYDKLLEKIYEARIADKHYSGKVEITELLKPFSHISIDENYKIIAYSAVEYHGPYGEAVAIEREREAPDVYLEHGHSLFQRIIPEKCYPVNEVLFCDGTPEGFLEVVILNDVLRGLFHGVDLALVLREFIMSKKEAKRGERLLSMLLRYAPQLRKKSNGVTDMLLLERSGYDGAVRLREYSFSNRIPTFFQRGEKHQHIKFGRERFSEQKSCCCYMEKSVTIYKGEDPEYW